MNNMRQISYKVLLVFLGWFLITGLPTVAFSQATIEIDTLAFPQATTEIMATRGMIELDEQVIRVAQESLAGYVKHLLNEKNYANFGFKNLEEARTARLGIPYRVVIIGLKDLKSYKDGTGAKPILIDTKILWFPVVVKGETRTKLEIIEKNGKLVAGEFGGVTTVQEVDTLRNQLPSLLENKGIKAPYKTMLMKIPALYAVFLYVESSDGEFLIPAMVQPQRFKLQGAHVYTVDEVLLRLREFAKEIDENKLM